MYHWRLIPDAELADLTPQELLDRGLVRTGTDPASGDGLYSVGVAHDRRGRPCKACDCELPGRVISEGFATKRTAQLPATLRAQVARVRVYRSVDGRPPERTVARARARARARGVAVKTFYVPAAEVRPEDVSDGTALPAHRWLGEPDR